MTRPLAVVAAFSLIEESGEVLDWLILTRPDEQRHSPEVIARKSGQVGEVADLYRMRTTTQLDFASGRLDTVALADIMKEITAAIVRAKPDVVYVVSPGDVHTDHGVAFRATMSVIKPFHMRALGVSRVLAYETLSSTEAAAAPSFVPNCYRDITSSLEEKLQVMSLYSTEAHPEPLPRSPSALRALARFRGATVATEYAEAFSLVRELA